MQQRGLGHIAINGQTSMKARGQRLARLRDDETCMVGLLSLGSCSTGLNLPYISVVLFVELVFDVIVHLQAEGRCHRPGHTKTVFSRYLLLQGSTDSMVWANVRSKKACQELLMNSSPMPAHVSVARSSSLAYGVESDSD